MESTRKLMNLDGQSNIQKKNVVEAREMKKFER